MVFFRYIIVKTLHKGDNKDDDDDDDDDDDIIIIIIIIIIIMKSRNYRKQPYWALHTYFGKY